MYRLDRKRGKIFFTTVFLLIAVLFLSSCSEKEAFTFESFEDTMPSDLNSFSSVQLMESVDALIANGEDSLRAVYTLSEDLESDIYAAIDSILSDSYLASCLLDDITFSFQKKLNYVEVSYSLIYGEESILTGKLHTVSQTDQLVPILLEEFQKGSVKTALLLDGCLLSEDSLFAVMNNAELNVGLAPCEASNIVYESYPPKDNRQLMFVWTEVGIDSEEWIQKQDELKDALTRIAQPITFDSSDPSTGYSLLYNAVLDSASYDYDLSASTLLGADMLTPEMHVSRSAYGALVSGMTVCTGYARAYKALCDSLGLPCWVLAGTKNGVEHAWNAVLIDSQIYYIDCTLGDTEPSENTFLISPEIAAENGYVLSSFSVPSW